MSRVRFVSSRTAEDLFRTWAGAHVGSAGHKPDADEILAAEDLERVPGALGRGLTNA